MNRSDAPPALTPPPGEPRFPLLDAVRGAAALGVVLAHAGGVTGTVHKGFAGSLVANLDAGVTLFFVLSGFLLYRPYRAAQADARSGPRLRDYARRRVLRIVPAYWVALTVIAAYPGLDEVFSGDWWRYYGFLQVYSTESAAGGLIAAWSLAVEVTFYAALPLLAVALLRIADWRRQLALLGALGLASAGLRAVDLFHQQAAGNANGWVARLTLPELFLWFAIGMALAVISVEVSRGRRTPAPLDALARHPGWTWAAAGAAYAAMCVVLIKPESQFTLDAGQWTVQHLGSAIVAFLLVVPAIFRGEEAGWPRRVLAHPVAAWTGLVSYGVFLWHGGVLPVLDDLGLAGAPYPVFALAAVACSLALGALSYYVVERPFLRLKDRPAPRRRPAPAPAR